MANPDRKVVGHHVFQELERNMLPVFAKISVPELEDIINAPQKATIEERIRGIEEKAKREALLLSHFNTNTLLAVSPSWFQSRNFLQEIISINEPHIWQAISSHSPRYEQGRRGQLKPPSGIDKQEWERIQNVVYHNPHLVTEANIDLFTLAFASLGLGAIVGTNFSQLCDTSNTMTAGTLVGEHYKVPAPDKKEGMQRLKSVYGHQGYTFLQQANAFEANHPEETPPRLGHCPFQLDPVRKLLEAFALHIQTEPYATYFAARISQ